jgi:hypothetical protein
MINAGEVIPVLRMWTDHQWLLLSIDRTGTRTRCCWVGASGELNVDRNTIPVINYVPDRISCELNP